MRRRIILDTDLSMGSPGSEIDDGFALALALAEPDLDVELVTTVNGNTDVESATLLTLELLNRLGRTDLPVVKGAGAPLLRPTGARTAPQDIVERYGHRSPAPGHAAVEIARRVMSAPGEITLVAIGPLTNVALALSLEPRVAEAAREIVIMGGSFLRGAEQHGRPGEFNISVDPEAASAVFHSGARLRAVGLDVTLQVRITRDHAVAMAAGPGAFSSFAGEYTLAWIDHIGRQHPGDPGAGDSCAMHDALAVAAVVRPELLTWRRANVDVVTGAGPARGMTLADLLTGADAPAANCEIAVAVDAHSFVSNLVDRIASL